MLSTFEFFIILKNCSFYLIHRNEINNRSTYKMITPEMEKAREKEICAKEMESVTEIPVYSKRTLIKNLIVIAVIWLFLFLGFFSLANLQSSLNSNDNLGTLSLSAIYAALIISSTFLPKLMIKFFGLKWTIVISQAAYIIYIFANIFPSWYTLIPGFYIIFYIVQTELYLFYLKLIFF
jgi:hypothetical protein